LSETPWDVAVVGAGPAGSVAALLLASRGRSVLLLDRSDFPRDKVCGDALVRDSLLVLERLSLLHEAEAIGRRTSRLRAYLPDRSVLDLECEFVCAPRTLFDDLLRRAAVSAGAEFRGAARVTGIEAGEKHACVTLADGAVEKARLVVVATGAASPLLELFATGAARGYDALAARAYYRIDPALVPDRVLVSYDRSTAPGYGWLFPLPGGVLNVGCGVFLDGRASPPNLARLFESFTSTCPEVSELVSSSVPLGPMRGAALRCGMRSILPARDRVIAIGEAQGATLPFSGEGIGKAMESAELAAEHADAALARDDLSAAGLSSFTRALEERMRPRYGSYEAAQRWIRRPFVVNVLGRRARKSAHLRRLMSGLLDESTPPGSIFSARALLESFVR
jgi:menaquinone-9 beta-reductase